MNKLNFTIKCSCCKFGTPSCSNYEDIHVYMAYRRQTIRPSAPPNKPHTAHITRGEFAINPSNQLYHWAVSILRLSIDMNI